MKKETKTTARLEARVSREIKEQWQKAAAIAGLTLTDFVIASVQAKAQEVIQQHQIIKLSVDDSKAFAEAILNPSQPNNALSSAASRYKKFLGQNDTQN